MCTRSHMCINVPMNPSERLMPVWRISCLPSAAVILWVLSSAVSCLEDRGTRADVVRTRKIGFPCKPVSLFTVSILYFLPAFKNAQTGGFALFRGGRSFLFFYLFTLLYRLLLTFLFSDRAGGCGVYLQAHFPTTLNQHLQSISYCVLHLAARAWKRLS